MSGIALPIDGVATPAADNRVADGALYLGRTDRPLGALPGVRPGSEPTVTFSGLTATLSPFTGVADPATSLAVGAYRVAFKAAETFTVNAADATNTRLDRVDVQVPDDPPGAAPLSAIIKYTAGVASATPALPAAPARSFFLGTITVPASGHGSPSWSTTGISRTVASGGILPVDGPAYYPPNPYRGQYVHDLSSEHLYRWSASAGLWKHALGVAYQGRASGNTDANGDAVISHGLPFTPSDVVVQSVFRTFGVNATIVVGLDTITSSSFTVRLLGGVGNGAGDFLLHQSSRAYSIRWIAYP